ncbi:hypothetical protein GCM10023149_06590 [Mucilaginibacter gynuensis]|uniref:Uncharacterized protein n=1 Tax=Mucilaginibacter gynuensis TaxID=1302236 RepID=A0ABP8FV92_9SPHI
MDDHDPLSASLYEMKLEEIYHKHDWLSYEISLKGFIDLFPVYYKEDTPLKPEMPEDFGLGKNIFLEVLVAFNQTFR